jgi:hypothetical protein
MLLETSVDMSESRFWKKIEVMLKNDNKGILKKKICWKSERMEIFT